MTGTKLKVTVLYDLWEEEPVAVEEEVPAPRKRKGQKKRKTKPVKHDREEIFEALEKLGHEPSYYVLDGRPQSLVGLAKCGAESVLAGGVDVAADVEAVLGDVVAGETAGDLLLGFQGPDSALADIVRGPDSGVRGEPEHVALAALAEFQQLAAGLLLHGVLRAGDAGDAGQPGQHRVPELLLQRSGDLRGDEGKLLLAGLVPGVDEAAQRPRRLHGPDGTGVGLGAVLVVAEQVLEACLVPGEVLPGLAEVVPVPVRDHHAREIREDPGLPHRVQAAGAQVEGGVQLGERAVDVLLLPGRT